MVAAIGDLVTSSLLLIKKTRFLLFVDFRCILAARVDTSHEHPTGDIGSRFKEEIEKKQREAY